MDEVSNKEKDMMTHIGVSDANKGSNSKVPALIRAGGLKELRELLGPFLLDGLDEEGNEIWKSQWDPVGQAVKPAPAIRMAEVAVRFTREGTPARRRAEKVLALIRKSKNFRDDYKIGRARREERCGG